MLKKTTSTKTKKATQKTKIKRGVVKKKAKTKVAPARKKRTLPKAKVKQAVKKNIKKIVKKPAHKGKSTEGWEEKAERLILKGRSRGFITYNEILKEFPMIEQDVLFLDTLYEKLSDAGVDILESGGLLEIEPEEVAMGKKYV